MVDRTKGYLILGITVVLALSLAVPALGGPSNPVASSAVSLAKAFKVAKKAKQKANAAQSSANAAQSSANAAQSSANNAQGTANSALGLASNVTSSELGTVTRRSGTGVSINDGTGSTSTATCLAGERPISWDAQWSSGGLVTVGEVNFNGQTLGGDVDVFGFNQTGASRTLTARIYCLAP